MEFVDTCSQKMDQEPLPRKGWNFLVYKERSHTGDGLNSLAVFVWHSSRGKTLLFSDAKPFSDKAGENPLPALTSWGGAWRAGGSQFPILGAVGQPETQEQ